MPPCDLFGASAARPLPLCPVQATPATRACCACLIAWWHPPPSASGQTSSWCRPGLTPTGATLSSSCSSGGWGPWVVGCPGHAQHAGFAAGKRAARQLEGEGSPRQGRGAWGLGRLRPRPDVRCGRQPGSRRGSVLPCCCGRLHGCPADVRCVGSLQRSSHPYPALLLKPRARCTPP